MRLPCLRTILLAGVLLCGYGCPAQTNIYALSVHTRWAVGPYPLRFGLEGYRKLGALYLVEIPSRKPAKGEFVLPGVKDYTSVILGPVAFSVPLPPESVVRVGICIFLALALALAALLHWWDDSASYKQSGL
jgi:hypothetical protein